MVMSDEKQQLNRREFLKWTGLTGVALLGGSLLSACGGDATRQGTMGGSSSDSEILGAAQIAEALATTTYTVIVKSAPFFQRLSSDDQAYFRAAREVEMAHYELLKSALNRPTPITTFYFPPNMFSNAKVTLDTLVTLEEAFIAAYLVGVRDLSTPALKVVAARILAVESDHRTVARVVATEIDPADGGPFTTLKGFSGVEEPVSPPNDNAFARTYRFASIQDAVRALRPFIDRDAAQQAGFDVSRPYRFEPFTPRLPNPRGGIDG